MVLGFLLFTLRFEPIDEQPKQEQYVTLEMFEAFKNEIMKEKKNGK
jgi:hypothetical protein